MREHLSTLLVCAAIALVSAGLGVQTAFAQDDMEFGLDEAGDDTPPDDGGGEGSDMDFSDPPDPDAVVDEGTDVVEGGDPLDGEPDGDGMIFEEGGDGGEIEGLDLGAEVDSGPTEPEEDLVESAEEIYAVQQIYALRLNRLEIAPSALFTVNDPFVSHPGAALALNFWFTNVLAVGVNGIWYGGLENQSDLNFFVQRSTRLAVPITEYQFGANLNFTYVPVYGKFAMFNEYIFQYDLYIVGGVGIMRTRPVPVVDPEIRSFDFGIRVAFNLGIGLRVFVSRFFAVYAELRDYAFLETLENRRVALGAEREDPVTWTEDSASLENNVAVQIGFTLFFPLDFEYKLPK